MFGYNGGGWGEALGGQQRAAQRPQTLIARDPAGMPGIGQQRPQMQQPQYSGQMLQPFMKPTQMGNGRMLNRPQQQYQSMIPNQQRFGFR